MHSDSGICDLMRRRLDRLGIFVEMGAEVGVIERELEMIARDIDKLRPGEQQSIREIITRLGLVLP